MASIDYDKLQVKLDAVTAKDTTAIKNKNAYIPFLGSDYIITDLDGWLTIVSDYLDEMKKEPNVNKVVNFVDNNCYKPLCVSCTAIADAIEAGEEYNLGEACGIDDYNRLRGLILFKLVYIP